MSELYAKLYETVEFGKPLVLEDIAEGLKSNDAHEVWLACKAAGLSKDEAWVPVLIIWATTKIPENIPDINSIAVLSLAKIGGGQVDVFWREALKSDSTAHRRAAADLLGMIGDERNLGSLVLLLQDEVDEVSSWAALSMSKIGAEASSELLNYLASTQSFARSVYCIDALRKINASDYAEAITSSVKNKSREVKSELLKVIDAKVN